MFGRWPAMSNKNLNADGAPPILAGKPHRPRLAGDCEPYRSPRTVGRALRCAPQGGQPRPHTKNRPRLAGDCEPYRSPRTVGRALRCAPQTAVHTEMGRRASAGETPALRSRIPRSVGRGSRRAAPIPCRADRAPAVFSRTSVPTGITQSGSRLYTGQFEARASCRLGLGRDARAPFSGASSPERESPDTGHAEVQLDQSSEHSVTINGAHS